MMAARPRVLVADDHPSMAKALTRFLSADCDVVGVVSDGREVAEAAARLRPVVIVLDVYLPNINGLDVCRQIAQVDPHARVLMVTAMMDEDIRREAMAAGASGFFHKAAVDDLIVAVRRLWSEANHPSHPMTER
jgi:DNA-binding NarL/FixJ family response regulator